MDIQYGDLRQLTWLWLIPLCAAATVYALAAARSARNRFATPNLIGRLLPPLSIGRLCGTTLLACAALAAMALALVDIRWGKEWQEVPQQGIELMFVLDVSRSMLAEDTSPNRLTRAKQQISDTIDELAGDRVGLVVFAGEAIQKIPLTSHYDDFKQTLQQVDPDSVKRGGSRLGDAIRVASDGFLTKTNDHKAMVIVTDGEDQESDPLGAAETAHADHGVRIFTIGLGDMDQGARIPVKQNEQRTYLQHEGQQVWSKLNGQILRQIAEQTDGAYIPAGTKRVSMSDVYHGYIADVPQQQFETARINRYRARFQWFLLPALVVILAEITWSTARSRSRRDFRSTNLDVEADGSQVLTRSATVVIPLLCAVLGESVIAADLRADARQYNQAVELYRAGKVADAEPLFESVAASLDSELAAKARFNGGNCHYRAALEALDQAPAEAIRRLDEAIRDYRSALELNAEDDDARINIELAARLRERLRQQLQQQQQQEQQQQSDQQQQPEQRPSDQQQPGEQAQQPQQTPGQSDPSERSDSSAQTDQTDQTDHTEQSPKPPASDPAQPSPESERQGQASPAESADEPTETPEGELETAGPIDPQDSDQDPPKSLPDGAVEGQMTPEEARKMLQAIRDREMLRQLIRQRAERSRRIPVEKDW